MSRAAGVPSGRALSSDGNSRPLFLAPCKRLRGTTPEDDLPTEPSELRQRTVRFASQSGRFDASCAAPAPIERARTRREQRSMSEPWELELRPIGAELAPCEHEPASGIRGPTERAGNLGSLDMDRLSDMLESSENAAIATVFALSTRWRMQPRKCKCGIQRTHLAAPAGTRDAVSISISASDLLGADVGSSPRWRVQAQCAGRSSGCYASLSASQMFPRCRESDPTRLRRRDCDRIGSRSTGGTGIAYPIEQVIPRLGMGSQNREGARK